MAVSRKSAEARKGRMTTDFPGDINNFLPVKPDTPQVTDIQAGDAARLLVEYLRERGVNFGETGTKACQEFEYLLYHFADSEWAEVEDSYDKCIQ